MYSKKLPIEPKTVQELCDNLASASVAGKTIALGGNSSKHAMGGPVAPADVTITTSGLNRILQYEPSDLTLSVEAGTPWAELTRVLARNQQMIPLDPPFADTATVGGVIATNGCGPRRRLYGSARDHVIGMKFATVEGKLVQSGGMVVKNVAGLDMGKLMIGSFGTLAAIAVVNFKLSSKPTIEKTSLLTFDSAEAALETRDKIIRGVLQPSAIDLLTPLATAQLGLRGYVLALQYGGNAAVVARYQRELGGASLEGSDEEKFWQQVIDYSPNFIKKFTGGAVVRVASTLTELREVLASLDVPVVARAASGVSYAYFNRTSEAVKWLNVAKNRAWKCVMEFAPEAEKPQLDLWPAPGNDFGMMKKVKQMFDPTSLLNHGRYYRLI